ncbi:beta strand repeat-containing protein [Thauera sp. AutoDN2]|uniref:beta strand repeat-containing protein n=1 Tax=Thauera sp. AutoDN2 TaxID=3416051 RepID=UPI003F4C3175
MAITSLERTQIQKVFIAMLNAAPSITYLDQLVGYAGRVDVLARDLGETSAFKSIYPVALTNEEFANKFVANFVGSTASAAAQAYVAEEVVKSLEAGVSRADTLFNVVVALQSVPDGDATFGNTKLAFENKVAVANYYAITLGGTATDLALLQGLIANVTPETDVSTPEALQAAIEATPAGTTGQTFMLTKGLDNVPGTSGNDTIIGSIDTSAGGAELNTISSLDLVNGGAGVDTLKISTADTSKTVTLPNLSNVEIIELQGSGTGGTTTLAAKSVAGLTDINVTKMAESVKVEAAAATNVNVTLQAANQNAVIVDGGNNVTVKLTDVEDDGAGAENDITIGTGGTAPKGDVVVEATAKAASDGVDIVMGAINITGGKTISVTQKVGSASALVAGGTSPDHTQGDVAIAADATTTTVTVKQDLAATADNGALAVAGVKEVVSVKFAALAAGETLSLTDGTNDLTFTATVAMTAAEVAAAFSNLNADAVLPTGATGDTQGSQIAAKGVFSDDGLDDWSSAAAVGDTVVFTAKTAGTTGLADNGGTKSATLTTTTAGVAAVDGVAPVLGVKVGDVQIAGGAALATVTVDSYLTSSDITGATNNALATVNLSNGADFGIASAAATLALNLTNVTGTVDVIAGTTTLNATVTTNSTTAATLKSATATAVNVSGTGLVAGTTAAGNLAAATAINTTGMTAGTATFTVADGTATTYTGGAAVDNVTVTNGGTAITKAIDLGAGNDTLKLDGTVVVPTATLKGGEGTDTLSMTVASAAARDGDTLFKAKLDSFERLTLNDQVNQASATTIDLENLGFTNYVTTNGTVTGNFLLTLDKMASGGTVVLTNTTAAAGIAVAVKDADTGTADVLNVVARVSTADIDHGLLTVADVETINITAEDTSTTAATNESTLTLKAAAATSVKVDGNADLVLKLDAATVKLATIDAGTLTGDLTVAAIGNVGLTITGGSGDDTLSASVGATAKTDVISGGAGNDIITAGSNGGNGAFLTGGDGNDLFVLTAAAADEGSKDANSYYMITDFQAGDLLQLGWYDITGTAAAAVTSFTKLDTNLNDNTASFDSFVSAAMAQIKAENEATWSGGEVSGTDDAEGQAIYFNYKGNAYVVVDSGVSTTGVFTGTEDLVIQLTGVNADNLSFNSDYATVALI